jgi:hypothetical protein
LLTAIIPEITPKTPPNKISQTKLKEKLNLQLKLEKSKKQTIIIKSPKTKPSVPFVL